MTQPLDPSAFASQISTLATANSQLIKTPQVALALANVGATQQQAGAVNAFLAYQGNDSAQGAISQAQGAGLTAQGAIDQVKAQMAQANQHHGISGFFYHVTHNPVTDLLGKGQNLTNATLSKSLELVGDVGNDIIHGTTKYTDNFQASEDQQMRAAGYDPDNPFSYAAFLSSGVSREDLTDLQSRTDPQTFTQVEQYVNNPEQYEKQITDSLSMSAEQKVNLLKQINSKDFQDIAKQLSARSSTVGHYLFDSTSTTGKWLAAGTDLAVGFKFDPSLAAYQAVKGVYLAPLSMAAMDAPSTVQRVLSGVAKSPAAIRTRQGFQYMIDQTAKIKAAKAEGDWGKVGVLDAQMQRTAPDLYQFKGDFAGDHQIKGWSTGAGHVKDPVVFGPGRAIESMPDALEYFGSELGLQRLRLGMPVEPTSLMPGRLSLTGARQLRGALSGTATKLGVRRLKIDLRKAGFAHSLLATPADNVPATAVVNAADPTGGLAALTGRATEGVPELEGAVPAGATAGKLPSQLRAATAADVGDVIFAKRSGRSLASVQGGTELTGLKGTANQLMRSLNPTTYNSRMRLLAQRWSSTLNRDELMSTAGIDMTDKVFKYGQIYLPRSYAHVLQGLYGVGDEGARKAILHSLALSQLHAAGLGTTVGGKALIDKFSEEFDNNVYGLTGSSYKDPATGIVRDSAIWASQLNEKLTMPNMTTLMKVAPKIGIWENTIGASLNRPVVHVLTDLARIGWVFRAATAVRAVQEDLASVFGRGRLGEHVLVYMAAKDAGLTIPYSAAAQRIFDTKAWKGIIAPIEHYYRSQGINLATKLHPELGLEYLNTHSPEFMAEMMGSYMSTHMRQMMNPDADIADMARAGYNVRQVKMRRKVGYGGKDAFDTDTSQGGATAYAAHLKTVFGGDPDYATEVMNYVDRARYAPDADPNQLFDDLVATHMNTPNAVRYSRDSVFRDPDSGVDIPVATEEEKYKAAVDHVNLQVREMHNLLHSADGRINGKLIDHLRDNRGNITPDWISENVPNVERPRQVLGAIYEPVPKGEGTKREFAAAVSNAAAGGYARLVEAPIARWSVQPQYLANYMRSMKEYEGYRLSLIKDGMSPEAALDVTRNISYGRAWESTMKYVDDPTVRDQLDIVGKAFFGFSRATTQFIRRWSKQLIEDPVRARRLMLTYEAAQQSGFMYKDSNGQQQFIFPGSGVALRALSDGLSHLGIGAYVPALLPNLGSRFAFLNPGLQGPFQYSLTPIGNIPLRALEAALPGHREMLDSIDTAINGQISAGEGFAAQLVPTVGKNIYQALNTDDRNSMLASSTNSAVLNLINAGQGPPANADAATRQLWLTKVRAGVKNQLFLRAVFAFFAPAAPSQPTEEVGATTEADATYKALGIRLLPDEYKKMINQMGFEEATAVWTGLHPDKVMYTVPTTQATEKGGSIGATSATLQWLRVNEDFMKGYSGISAYFIPAPLQQGPFDIRAYNAELELGLRQHKTTEDYFNDVAAANSSKIYFDALHQRDLAVEQHPDAESKIRSAFSDWAATFAAQNPVFAASQPDFGAQTVNAKDQLAQLARLAKDPSAPSDVDRGLVATMVNTYNAYHEALLRFPTQSNADNAGRAALGSAYNSWWSQFLGQHYEMGSVYTGVFRTLDNKTLDSLTPLGS
jgi:hypothetical protein